MKTNMLEKSDIIIALRALSKDIPLRGSQIELLCTTGLINGEIRRPNAAGKQLISLLDSAKE